jgi:hypothetical protein
MAYLIVVEDTPSSSIMSEVQATHDAVKKLVTTSQKIDKQMDRMESALLEGMEPETIQAINKHALEVRP